jgi:ferredoxin-NADP reductase
MQEVIELLSEHLPGSWLASWNATRAQLRRDVNVLRRRAAGYGLPPLVTVRARAEPPRGRAETERTPQGRELEIARVARETNTAVTLVLRNRDGRPFEFRPGQFFTVLSRAEDGELVPRNYSASNAPGSPELHLTIKVKKGGRISPRLARLEAGDVLQVRGPFGSFVLDAAHDAAHDPRRLVLVAGGAGITPLASIARTVLAREPAAQIALVYANQHEDDVIFRAALDALADEHATRLALVHVTGGLDRATAARTFDALPLASHSRARFFVCGPDGMRDEVLAALASRGVASDAVAIERFSTGPRPRVATSSAAIAAAVGPGARPVAIRFKDRTHSTTALPGATVLEAGLAAGAPMPFSCAVGGCGACKVKVVEGSVEVDEPNCLTEAERAAGFVLACVGRPCGPCVVEVVETEATEATDRGGA